MKNVLMVFILLIGSSISIVAQNCTPNPNCIPGPSCPPGCCMVACAKAAGTTHVSASLMPEVQILPVSMENSNCTPAEIKACQTASANQANTADVKSCQPACKANTNACQQPCTKGLTNEAKTDVIYHGTPKPLKS